MARSEFASQNRTRSRFVNRAAEFELLKKHLGLALEDPAYFAVFEILGLGGIGKTRLLREFRDIAGSANKKLSTYWLNLSSESNGGSLAPLRALRSQVAHDCMLFDAASLIYWTDTGQQFPLTTGSSKSSNVVLRAAEAGGGAAGIPLPLTFAADVYHAIETRVSKNRHYTKDEFEAIDELRHRPSQVLRRLPHYLATDMLRRSGSKLDPFVIFYDAYAAQSPSTLEQKAPWLREFIGSLDAGLHVISTREPLRWEAEDWGDISHHIALGGLPVDECRMLIHQRVGEVPEPLEARLLDGSHGIPFFLEIGLDAIESRENPETVKPQDLPSSPRDAVAHLLRHLTPAERQAAIALGSLQLFDRELYVDLISSLNLAASALDFKDIVDWFFVEEDLYDLFRVNPILSDYVRTESVHRDANTAALHAASAHLKLRAQGVELESAVVVALFQEVLSGWAGRDEVPTSAIEDLVEIGYALYDSGLWIEVGEAEPQTTRPLPKGHPCRVVSEFFTALSHRRSEGPNAALKRLGDLEPLAELLGQRRRSFDIEVAYISELSGDYAMARERFRELDLGSMPFNPRNREHYRARLYHADMLTMDGSFVAASHLLLEAYELLDTDRPTDWAELVRHRGHVMRFCHLHEEAELLYLRALNASRSSAMMAKLQTNLAETYCWTDPQAAITTATTAIELHAERGTVIEIVKCHAALAIAYSSAGDAARSRSHCGQAESLARKAGYPAGEAFAAQAHAVVEARAGNIPVAAERHSQLQTITQAIGTYSHLGAITAVAAGDELTFIKLGIETEWIDDENLEERVKSTLIVS